MPPTPTLTPAGWVTPSWLPSRSLMTGAEGGSNRDIVFRPDRQSIDRTDPFCDTGFQQTWGILSDRLLGAQGTLPTVFRSSAGVPTHLS